MMPSSTSPAKSKPKRSWLLRLLLNNAIVGFLCCWRRDARPKPIALSVDLEKEPDDGNPKAETPALALRGTPESRFLKLPPKVFNVIAGFLDIPSLLQLARSDPKLEKLVRDSEKHWKDVFVTSEIFCIDYDCYDKGEAEILLANAKIDNYKEEESVADARELIELPTELVEMILKPLDFLSLLEVEKCHKRFAVLGRRVPVQAVYHLGDEFDISLAGFEPKWRLPDPDQHSFLPKWGPILDRNALDGRHVETVFYNTRSDTRPCSPKVKPRFTCTTLCPTGPTEFDSYLDTEIIQNYLKPYHIQSNSASWPIPDRRFPRGALVYEYVEEEDLEIMLNVETPRFTFRAADADEWLCKVFYHYIDEWLTGWREIATIWVNWTNYSRLYEGPDYDGFLDFVLPGLVNRYGFALDSEGIVRGQLKRDDGKMLEIRARRDDVVLQARGSNPEFLIRTSPGWPEYMFVLTRAPVF